MDPGVFFIALVFSGLVMAATVVNVRRAPPPTGRRNMLLVAVFLFVAGTLMEGAEEASLASESVALWGDVLRLLGAMVLVYVFVRVRDSLEEEEV